MPTFQITAPDGRKYTVIGDNKEGALNALRQHLGGTSNPSGVVTKEMARQELARRELARRQEARQADQSGFTLDQQKAIAQARARLRLQEQKAGRSAITIDGLPAGQDGGGSAGAGLFDDLIPLQNDRPNAGAGLFNDLIPAQDSGVAGNMHQPNASAPWGKLQSQAQTMKRYEVDIDGTRYEMEAPDEETLMKAVDQLAATQRGSQADGSVSANNVVRSVATGVPVIGGALNKMNAATNAALAPLINPLLSDENQLKGGTWEERYNRSLAMQEGMDNAYETQHPILAGAGNVVGAVGGTVPLIMAAPTAMGAGTGGLAMRTAASTFSGAALGGADSAVRSGGDANETLKGAGFGAAGGVVAPVAGQIVGSGLKAARNGIANMATRADADLNRSAAKHLSQSLAADGLTASEAATRLRTLGPDAMIADLGPTLQGDAAALANIPGRSKEIVREALHARSAGANARLAEGVNSTLGPALVPSQVETGIETAQKALSPRYTEALKGARAVDTSDVANALESQIVNLRGPAQKAVRQVRNMLDIPGAPGTLDPNPGAMLQTRQAIDGMLKTEADPNAIRALTMARQSIDERLASSVPGLKPIDAQFEELARQQTALTRGRSALDTGKTAPHPMDVERELVEGALPRGEFIGPSAGPTRYRQGVRAEIERLLGHNANDVAKLNQILKADGDWPREKLARLFGSEKADKLFEVLEREKLFAATRDAATGNSVTAARQAAMRRLGAGGETFGMRQAYEAGGLFGLGRSAALKATDSFTDGLMKSIKEKSRTKLAKAVTDNRRQVIEALMELEARKAARAVPSPMAQALLMTGGQRR